MLLLEMPEFRKLVEAYRNGYLTFSELKEELEGYWNKTIDGIPKAQLVVKNAGPVSPAQQEVR